LSIKLLSLSLSLSLSLVGAAGAVVAEEEVVQVWDMKASGGSFDQFNTHTCSARASCPSKARESNKI
jgi:Na+-translocating ferredoxin:NAD+ oxidoreductase RnfG subunit